MNAQELLAQHFGLMYQLMAVNLEGMGRVRWSENGNFEDASSPHLL